MITKEKWNEIEEHIIEQVKILDMSNKGLITLPCLLKYKNLMRLIASNNNLKFIDIQAQNLKYIDLRNNQIEQIINLPTKLIHLDLRNNNIIDIDIINSLPNLKILLLDNNKISNITSLPLSLIRFDITNNHLIDIDIESSLPSSILVYNKSQINYHSSDSNEIYKYSNKYSDDDDSDIILSSK